MNWTGGQLHRQTTRQGVLSRTQRHNFAKSRQRASNGALGQFTPFRGYHDPSVQQDGSEAGTAVQYQSVAIVDFRSFASFLRNNRRCSALLTYGALRSAGLETGQRLNHRKTFQIAKVMI